MNFGSKITRRKYQNEIYIQVKKKTMQVNKERIKQKKINNRNGNSNRNKDTLKWKREKK